MGQVLEPFRDYETEAAESEANGTKGVYVSIQGWRPTQEDSHTLCCEVPGHKNMSFFAVFDGHGGPSVSRYASSKVLELFTNSLPQGKFTEEVVQRCLTKAIKEADSNLRVTSQGKFQHEGCTAIISVVTEKAVVTANVGDSRAILVSIADAEHSKIAVAPLSKDQKPGNELEQKRIEAAGSTVIDCSGVMRVNGDLAVARALGDFSFKNPDLSQDNQAVSCNPEVSIVPRNLDVAQVLVLACDGIWDVLSNDVAGQMVSQALADRGGLYPAAQLLVDESLALDSRDNMSVLLCDLNGKFERGEAPVYVPEDEGEGEDGAAAPQR